MKEIASSQVTELAVLDALRSTLSDSDPLVRRAACLCAGEIEDKACSSRLAELTQDPDPDVQEAAVRALGRVGGEEDLPLVRRILKEGSEAVRQSAAVALAELAGRNAASELTAALSDKDASVRWAAVAALGDLEVSQARDAMAELLTDEEPKVQLEAAFSLARLEDTRGVEVLCNYTTDPDWSYSCCEILGRLKDSRAASALRRACSGFRLHPFVKLRASASLAMLGHEDARKHLVRFTRSFRPSLRALALELLGEVGGTEVLDLLLDALVRNRSPWGAARGLAHLKDPRALDPMRRVMERCSDPELVVELKEAIRQIEGAEEERVR